MNTTVDTKPNDDEAVTKQTSENNNTTGAESGTNENISEEKASKPAEGKNIVIFSDGTGQEGGVGNNTNVYNVFNMILDRSQEQISFYDQGLGTGDNLLWGSIAGAGISENVGEAYQFLSNNFNIGDCIYLFGFSRGATTMRSLTGFIHLFGILPRSRPELFFQAWDIYRISNKARRNKKAQQFIKNNHTMWTKVRFLGVWDTVAALELPFKPAEFVRSWFPGFRYSFHDLKISRCVEYARHAVAIDDQRLTFHPVLFEERGGRKKAPSLPGGDLFSTEDVTDLYLTAERLNDPNNPVSKIVKKRFRPAARKLLNEFEKLEGRFASPNQEDELRNVIIDNFNTILDSGTAICELPKSPNPAHNEKIAALKQLSATTRESLDKISTSSPQRDITRLNRLLIEDVYSLKFRIKQVWFAGMHTDIGGGYKEYELSHIPLLWMVNEAMDLGLKIYPDHKVDLRPDATGEMHDSRKGLGKLYRSRSRDWDPQQHQGRPPIVHRSVIERRRADSGYNPWIFEKDFEEEAWPVRLQRSVQFNDERIWRKAFWGWGAHFNERWSDIEKIALDEFKTSFSLIMKETGPIHVQGSLPKNVEAFVRRLEEKREQIQRKSVEKKLRKMRKDVKGMKQDIIELRCNKKTEQ